MSDPMTPERITEIRRRADLVREFGERPTVEASAGDVPALLAEVERLRAELDAWAKRGRDRRTEGERAEQQSRKLLIAGDRDGADRECARAHHELQAANAIACNVRFGRAHLERALAAHPAVAEALREVEAS